MSLAVTGEASNRLAHAGYSASQWIIPARDPLLRGEMDRRSMRTTIRHRATLRARLHTWLRSHGPQRFRFRIVRGPEFGPGSLAEIRRLAEERFGTEVEYDCEYLDRIPPEPSGKYRFCISKVKNPFSILEAAAR